MRYLLYIIIAAAVCWSGYWFFGANRLENELADWFEMRRIEGWQADYSDLSIQGYPNRFDTSFTDLAVADPRTGVAWTAPFFQILALSYKPHHVIAVWPEKHRLLTPLATFDLLSEDMRASMIVNPSVDLELNRVTLTADKLDIRPRADIPGTHIDKLSLAAELPEGSGVPSYHLGLSAADVTLPAEIQHTLDPLDKMPATLAGFKADMTVKFDAYWNRYAIERARPQPRYINIHLAEARWGELLLQATGELNVDEYGIPKGEITIKAENWRDILQMARVSGQVSETMLNLLENGLIYLAAASGNSKHLDVPLTFKKGQIRIGPLPIAPAPVIRFR